jgi:hypothetical protein
MVVLSMLIGMSSRWEMRSRQARRCVSERRTVAARLTAARASNRGGGCRARTAHLECRPRSSPSQCGLRKRERNAQRSTSFGLDLGRGHGRGLRCRQRRSGRAVVADQRCRHMLRRIARRTCSWTPDWIGTRERAELRDKKPTVLQAPRLAGLA